MVAVIVRSLNPGCDSGMKVFRIKNQIVMSNKTSPTTERPITAPLRKAILSPQSRDVWQAIATLDEANVAALIPKNPARPLKNHPKETQKEPTYSGFPDQRP